jgi:hypothetical protein
MIRRPVKSFDASELSQTTGACMTSGGRVPSRCG